MDRPSAAIITSVQNARVKTMLALRKERGGAVVVEGAREIALALAAGLPVRAVWRCPSLLLPAERELLERLAPGEAERHEVAPHVFAKIAYREHPGGLLVVFAPERRRLADLALPEPALLLVVEGVEKPGNLGAMLRSAEAAGAHAALFCDCPPDLYNPNLIRASLGAVFTLPVVETTRPEAIRWLGDREITLLLAQPRAETLYHACDLRGPTAIVVGSESGGISSAWRDAGAREARIPMAGRSDSLNVSVAAAILLFEVVRQRQGPPPPL